MCVIPANISVDNTLVRNCEPYICYMNRVYQYSSLTTHTHSFGCLSFKWLRVNPARFLYGNTNKMLSVQRRRIYISIPAVTNSQPFQYHFYMMCKLFVWFCMNNTSILCDFENEFIVSLHIHKLSAYKTNWTSKDFFSNITLSWPVESLFWNIKRY